MRLEKLSEIKDSDYRRILKQYLEKVLKVFKSRIIGVILFGSVAKGNAKPFSSAESDIDLIVVIRNLPNIQDRIIMISKLVRELELPSIIQAIYMTPEELESHIKSMAGWIINAMIDGIILYDTGNFLTGLRERLLKELEEKGVERTSYGWVWPIRAGERTF